MNMCYNNVTWGLKATIVEPAETAITLEGLCKRQVTAGNSQDRGNKTITKLWEEMFSMRAAATDA
jgi:hypothetical protein